jgi:hypothetical protein
MRPMSKWWINGKPFTCRNGRFQTDLRQGHPRGPAQATGSVLPQALLSLPDASLWLEYVEDHKNGGEMFWLMWYDAAGEPTVPSSSVFDTDELQTMIAQLSSFMRPPGR